MLSDDEQLMSDHEEIKIGDIVVAVHPEYYTFGPDGYYGIVVEIDSSTCPRKITFMRSDRLWSFYEDDLGIVRRNT